MVFPIASDFDLSFHINQQEIQNPKYFIFKGKQYQVDFDKVIKNSRYFDQNRKKFKQVDNINILDEADNSIIDITEDVIQAFIASCQNEPCKIHFSDVIPLQYLSYKYDFPKLIEITEKFVEEHRDKLVFNSILFKLNVRPNSDTFSIPTDFFNTKNEEEIIAEHLNDYIKNDQMLQLPVHVLYKIFAIFKSKCPNKLRQYSTEIIEFLFKCLDKYGKDASVLFSFADFENQSIGVMNRLIQNYSSKFDFNFINETLLKTTIQLTSEVTRIKEEYSILFAQMKQRQDEEIIKMKENEKKRAKNFEQEIAKMREEELKREKEFAKMKEEQERRVKIFEEKIERMKEEDQKRKKKMDEEMTKIKEKVNQNGIVKEFIHQKGNEFHGIMRYLTEQTGGNIHDNNTIEITTNTKCEHPKNLVDYDKDNYYNSDSVKCESKICFDFKNKSIQLYGYSIKSYENDTGDGESTENSAGHLRNWVIEVSNDRKTWKTIDQHNNDSTLNGSNIVATFNINPRSSNFFRYIQLRSTGVSWYGGGWYDIFFYNLEFYGKLRI